MTQATNQRDSQGLQHGLWEWYHPDGHLVEREHYHHGKRHGLWEDYRPDGTTSLKRYHLQIR